MYEPIESLQRAVITKIEGMESGSEEVKFTLADGRIAIFWHSQDCCESVEVNDVEGDIADLIGAPLLVAEIATADADADVSESGTWTFYRFATVKGWVVVRWLGVSNGYYSESVSYRISDTDGKFPRSVYW